MRDPVSWALHAINNPHLALADIFRQCQDDAVYAGQDELLKIAVDTDARVRQLIQPVRETGENAG